MNDSALPKLEVTDIIQALDGVCNSKVDTTGSTKPLLECVVSGVLRGAAVMLGTDGSEVRDTEEYVALFKKLIANDIVVLAIGYPVKIAAEAGLLNLDAKDLCGAGLKRVCELAEIPPVLPLGGLENVGNVVTIATALCNDSGLTVPQLPVVGCDAAGVTAQAVELGNTFAGLGVDTFIGIMPYEGSLDDVIAASGLKNGPDATQTVSSNLDELADALIVDIEKKRSAIAI
ncbi:MAG: hypothetical protein LUD16_10270 [Lachnospiraceae bacterium]|nr:hypothetical protein [Lachnospiraceae bacterium]